MFPFCILVRQNVLSCNELIGYITDLNDYFPIGA